MATSSLNFWPGGLLHTSPKINIGPVGRHLFLGPRRFNGHSAELERMSPYAFLLLPLHTTLGEQLLIIVLTCLADMCVSLSIIVNMGMFLRGRQSLFLVVHTHRFIHGLPSSKVPMEKTRPTAGVWSWSRSTRLRRKRIGQLISRFLQRGERLENASDILFQ